MKSLSTIIAVMALAGCTASEPSLPTAPIEIPPPTIPAVNRIPLMVDSLNATIRQMYQENGGVVVSVQLIYLDAIPPDPNLPPIVVLFVGKQLERTPIGDK